LFAEVRVRVFACVAVVAFMAMIGCVTTQTRRTDIAVIWAGDVQIDSIDRYKVGPSNDGFDIRPGGHTIDVTVSWSDAVFNPVGGGLIGGALAAAATPHHVERRLLCLKARGGREYRIKTVRRDGGMDAFIVDLSTGEPPKTPCGPDEDDD